MSSAGVSAAKHPLWPRVVLLLGALLAAGCGLLQTTVTWFATPAGRLSLLDPKAAQGAFEKAAPRMSAEAKAANLCINLSYLLQQAYRDPASLGEQRRIAHDLAFRVQLTNLPRLQLAALVMMELDRLQAAPATWGEKLKPYLDGLDGAPISHEMAKLATHSEGVFREIGAGKLVGLSAAIQRLGEPHGVFLQLFTPNMRRMIQAQREAGDAESADRHQRLLRRVLAEFVRAEGPIGARLLAAEQLAGEIEAVSNNTGAKAVAAALRDWRADYIEWARKTPIAPPMLDPFLRTPLPHGPPAEQALTGLVWVDSLGVAVIVCGAAALGAAAWWLSRRERGPSARQALALGFAPAPAILFVTWLILRGMDLPADFRLFAGEWTSPPRHLAYAVLIVVAMLLWIRGRPTGPFDRARRFGGVATGLLLWLSVAWIIAGFFAVRGVRSFSQGCDAAMRQSWSEPTRPGGEVLWQRALDAAKAVNPALPSGT